MSIDSLYPYAGSHAVVNAVFAVEWAEPLKPEMLKGLSRLTAKFRNLGLSNLQYQNSFEMKIEQPHGSAQPKQSAQVVIAGLVFARPASIGDISRSVTISQTSCMISIPDYTRWIDVAEDVQAYFKIVMEEIAPLRPLTVIGLQYHDLFSWKDNPDEMNLREIFAENSFIPENVFKQQGLWHLHHGYVVKVLEPVHYSRLDNVNVDMIEQGGERAIQIIGAHRATLQSPMWQAHMKNRAAVVEVLASLHDANKEMLLRLLTEQVCQKIRLTA